MPVPINILYQTTLCSDTKPYGVTYRITIHDTELLANADRDMQLEGEGFTIEYKGDENDLLATILPSTLKLFFVVKNNDDIDFLNELAKFQEKRFYISIERRINPDDPWAMYWRGIVMQDLIQYDDTRGCPPFTVEINAVDGLARLKQYAGVPQVGPAGHMDINEIIISMLRAAAPDLMFQPGDYFFRHNVKWFAQNHTPGAVNGYDPIDPLRYTKSYSAGLFYTLDGSNIGYKTIPWWDVINRIMRSYGARLLHVDGGFSMVQVEAYDKGKGQLNSRFNIYSNEYTTPNSPDMNTTLGTGVISYNTLLNLRRPGALDLTLVGNLYNLLPQYYSILLRWETPGEAYLITPITQDWRSKKCTAYVVGLDQKINYYLDFQAGAVGNWSVNISYYVELTTILLPATKYYVNSNWAWDTNPNSKYTVKKTGFSSGSGNVIVNSFGSFPPAPADGTLCIYITISNRVNMNAPPINQTLQLSLQNYPNSIAYQFNLPNFPDSSLQYIVESPMFGNNKDKVDVPFTDIWATNYWGKPDGWVRNSPTNGPGPHYAEFLGKSIVALYNDISRKKYYGDIWDDWSPMWSILYDEAVFIFNRAILKPDSGYWDVTLLEVRDQGATIGWSGEREILFGKTDGASLSETLENVGEEFMRYKGAYIPDAAYQKNDVVLDNGWQMIALLPTTSRPAPDLIGLPIVVPTSAMISNNFLSAVVISGNRFIFAIDGLITGFSVYVPSVSASHRLIIRNNTTGVKTYKELAGLLPNTWIGYQISGFSVATGDSIDFLLETINYAATSDFNSRWNSLDYNATPLTGDWSTNSSTNRLSIAKTDAYGVNQETTLQSYPIGTKIKFVDPLNTGSFIEFKTCSVPTDEGNYFIYEVTVVNESGYIQPGTTCDYNSKVPVLINAQYAYEAEYWSSNQPMFAAASGLLNEAENYNSYGVGITFQQGTKSNDWGVLSYSKQEGESTGGGIEEAPINGNAYRRINGAWDTDPIQSDAPFDSFQYGRSNGGWVQISASGGDKNYVHNQVGSASVWFINHALNKYPSVTVTTSAGDVVYGDVFYNDLNNIQISFKNSFSGKATLN